MAFLNPKDFIITRKRKLYKFALFNNSAICFEFDEWNKENAEVDNLEIGAGTGFFSEALAAKNPTKNFVAVDVKADRLVKGAIKAEQDGIKNITAINSQKSKKSSNQKTQLDQNRENFSNKLNANDQETQELVEKKIKAKGIPVEIYNQKKHNGLFKI